MIRRGSLVRFQFEAPILVKLTMRIVNLNYLHDVILAKVNVEYFCYRKIGHGLKDRPTTDMGKNYLGCVTQLARVSDF